MEGVACYDSDSDSDSDNDNDNANEGQKRNESKGLVQKWLEEEGEDEDEEGDGTKDIVNSNSSSSSSNSSLSVDALFNGDTSKESKFLHTIAGKDEFKIPQFKQEESERVCTTRKQQQQVDNNGKDRDTKRTLSKTEELKLLDKQIEELKRSTGKGDTEAKRSKDLDMSIKDKVKRQRLAGQTGISGGWKSEEEMRNRQLFD